MIENIKAIVSGIKDYKDNDQLLEVITEKYGVLSLVAKGTKKPGAKLHYVENSLYEISLDYNPSKTMFSIINSKSIKNYIKYDDSFLSAFVNIMYEMIHHSKEFCTNDTYDYILFLLANINHDNYNLLGSIFIVHIMKLHGISPYVDGCVVCGAKNVVSISNDLGGFTCIEHRGDSTIFDPEFLLKFRIICKCDIKNYEVVKDYKIENEIFIELCRFFIYNSDINLKSFDFYLRVI